MTKQEKIQEAYGRKVLEADCDGWIRYGFHTPKSLPYFEPIEEDLTLGIWRPKSLQGIEDNNGWIKIESESDLPEFTTNCWVVKNKIIINQSIYKNKGFITDGITHYKPITKPKPPIY